MSASALTEAQTHETGRLGLCDILRAMWRAVGSVRSGIASDYCHSCAAAQFITSLDPHHGVVSHCDQLAPPPFSPLSGKAAIDEERKVRSWADVHLVNTLTIF